MSNSHRRPDVSGLLYNRAHIYGTYSGCGHSALMRLSSLSAIAMWSYSLEASNGRTRDVLIAEHVETFNSRALVRLTTMEKIYQKNLDDSTPILLVLVHAHTIAFAVSHPCFKQTASWIHSELLRRCLLQSHPTVPFLQLHHIVMVLLRVSIRYTLALNSCFSRLQLKDIN